MGNACRVYFFFSSRRRHTRFKCDWSSDVCSSDLPSGRWQALVSEAGFAAAPPARHRGCAFGDFDGDGRMDVVVTALLEPTEIWMNRTEGAGHWLDISLQGTKSNRDGIGAAVKVVTKTDRK